MSTPITYTWPAANTEYVALIQSLGQAGSMLINGSAVPTNLYGIADGVNFYGFSRTLTLTSTNNNSGVNFTIEGYYEGRFGIEVIAGPNNNTVETLAFFDTITSITTNGAINDVSVGIGFTGSTNWLLNDYNRTVYNLTIVADITGTINYTFDVTLDDANIPGPITIFSPIVAMTGATTDQLANYTTPVRYCRVKVNSSTGNATLKVTYLQQGIT